MKKAVILILSLLMIIIVAGCSSQGKVTKESTNNGETNKTSSQVESKYKSVVAGTSTAAEYLEVFDIPLKGVSQQDNIPEKYKDVERIGAPRNLNMEKIVSLHSDLFIGDNSLKDLSQSQMNKQGIKTLYLDNSNYESILDSVKEIGKMFDKKEKADEIIKKIEKDEATALKGSKALKGKKVAILFGTGESYMLATKTSYLGSLLDKLGVKNVADIKSSRPYIQFSLENIIEQNPDYVLTLSHGHKEQASKVFDEELKKDIWQQTNAVKNGKTYALDDKKFPVTGNINVAETTKALKDLLIKGDTTQ